MEIRKEQPIDQDAIFQLTAEAFETMPYSDGSEPVIIDRLRKGGDLTLSLVAVEGSEIVGHIAFSPVTIDGADGQWFGLGPVSVAVKKQRRGIGSKLIHAGLACLRQRDASGCVLVGDPAFYSRFGFVSDGKISCEGVPAQFVQWLSFNGTQPNGVVEFSPGFGL